MDSSGNKNEDEIDKDDDDAAEHINSAVMVFAGPLVETLNEARLPSSYIGVRRVRPSSASVKKASRLEWSRDKQPLKSNVVFKVTSGEDGKERRMTRKEKREVKKQIAAEQKKRKLETNTICRRSPEEKEQEDSAEANFLVSDRRDDNHYILPLNSAAIEEEIADLRGERGSVPPVFLSPAMALQAQGILPRTQSLAAQHSKCLAKYDHELSVRWAKELKESMSPSEITRGEEDMRPMAYNLFPEKWSRLRPDWNADLYETRIHKSMFTSSPHSRASLEVQSIIDQTKRDWAAAVCRPMEPQFDVDAAIVFEYLHQQQKGFYISCGAKFGCDFLVYDGKREERHAFSGMRVLALSDYTKSDSGLPLPTSYSLAGYVRCLNTAGKLALLATVVRDTTIGDTEHGPKPLYRVAFVDVALEKVLTKKRKILGKNLAKN